MIRLKQALELRRLKDDLAEAKSALAVLTGWVARQEAFEAWLLEQDVSSAVWWGPSEKMRPKNKRIFIEGKSDLDLVKAFIASTEAG